MLQYKNFNGLWDQIKHNRFIWQDDEIQLLLQTYLEYKTKQKYKHKKQIQKYSSNFGGKLSN